jgi:hypothetical protein
MNEKPGLYAALGGFLFFNGALVLFSAFFSTWFLGREWVASICSPSCREGFFSATGLPVYLVPEAQQHKKGAGAPLPRFLVSPLRLNT